MREISRVLYFREKEKDEEKAEIKCEKGELSVTQAALIEH